MSQQQINRAANRKPTYRHLNPPQKRIIKLLEQQHSVVLSRVGIEYGLLRQYGKNWRTDTAAQLTNDYRLFYDLLREELTLNDRLNYQERKYQSDREQVQAFHEQVLRQRQATSY